MELIIAIIIGALFGGGVYCILRRSMMKLIVGILLLSQGTNLLVFTSSGLTAEKPVFIDSYTETAPVGHADPLPQALVLTAIVIGFGLILFTISLLYKSYRSVGCDDINAFNQTDRIS